MAFLMSIAQARRKSLSRRVYLEGEDITTFFRWLDFCKKNRKGVRIEDAEIFTLCSAVAHGQNGSREAAETRLFNAFAGYLLNVCMCFTNRGIPLSDLIAESSLAIRNCCRKRLVDQKKPSYSFKAFIVDVSNEAQGLVGRHIENYAGIIYLPNGILKAVRTIKKLQAEGNDVNAFIASKKDLRARKAELLDLAKFHNVSLQQKANSGSGDDDRSFEDKLVDGPREFTSSKARYLRLVIHQLTKPKKDLPQRMRPYALTERQGSALLSIKGGCLDPRSFAESGGAPNEMEARRAVSRGGRRLKAYLERFPIPLGRLTSRAKRGIRNGRLDDSNVTQHHIEERERVVA